MIAYCILGVDFLDKFQVTISFEDQCMYTKDENGSRRRHFVSEEMSKAELKKVAPIRGIRKFYCRSAVPILFASRSTFQERNSSRSTIVTLIPKARMCIFGCF